MTPDPIGLRGGLNPFTYVDNNPLRWVDPQGLTKWTGTIKSAGIVIGVGAGGMLIEVTSECVNGKRAHVKALGVGPGFGVGAKLPKIPEGPSGTVSGATFDDFMINALDPGVFNGSFGVAGASVVIGGGVGHQKIQCGHAFATVTGASLGLDVGATGFSGTCTVLESRIEDCCSK